MLSRITKKKEGTLSSPNGKSSGLHNLSRKPSPYVELPRHVTIPLIIRTNRPTHQATTVQVLEKPRQWLTKQNPTTQPTDRKCNMHICQWYRKKRAAKKLAEYHKMEKERAIQERLAKERADIEQRAIEHFKMQALLKQYEIPTPKSTTEIEQSPKTKKRLEKERKDMEKQALKHFRIQDSIRVETPKKTKDNEQRALEHFKKHALRKQYKIPTPKSSTKIKQSAKTKRRLEKERKYMEKQALKHFQIQESIRIEDPKKTKDIEHKALDHLKMQALRKQYEIPTPESSTKIEQSPKTKKRLEKERKELEKQALKHFQIQESISFDTPRKTKVAKKMAYAKPRTATRAVKEKRLSSRYDDIGVRFINCFYRICCQLYCCFTCFLIIGFVVIVVL